MKRLTRFRPVSAVYLVLAATACLLAATPDEATAQTRDGVSTAIRLDARAARSIADQEQMLEVSEVLRRVGRVDVAGSSRGHLVLHVIEMRGDRVVRRFESRPFAAPARGTVAVRDVLPAGQPDFGEFMLDPQGAAEATKQIPATDAVEQPGRFVINGVIPFHPKDWESVPAYYIAAVPADGRAAAGASAGIGVLFADYRMARTEDVID